MADIGNVPRVAKRGIELGGVMVLLQVDSGGVLELFFVNVKKVDAVALVRKVRARQRPIPRAPPEMRAFFDSKLEAIGG